MTYLEAIAVLIVIRCDMYLTKKGVRNSLSDFPAFLGMAENCNEKAMKNWADEEARHDSGRGDYSCMEARRYFELLDMLKADEIVRSLVDLAICGFYYSEFKRYLEKFFGFGICLKLACLIEEEPFPDECRVLKRSGALSLFFGIDLNKSPIMYQEISLDDRTMGFLSGDDSIGNKVSLYGYLFSPEEELHESFIRSEIIKRGVSFFENGGKVLQLSGKGGRRFLAKHIGKKLGKKVLFLNVNEVKNAMGERFFLTRNVLIREALYQKSMICLYGLSDKLLEGGSEDKLDILRKSIISYILDNQIMLVMCCDLQVRLLPDMDGGEFRMIDLDNIPTFDERKLLWNGFVRLLKLDINPNEAAMRYHLNPSETSRMARGLMDIAEKDAADRSIMLSKLSLNCAGIADSHRLGQIVFSKTRLSDVKLDKKLRSTIEDAIGSVTVSHRVFDEWELKNEYCYGCATSILLSGPPGTGKTMTANAIAGELGIPLYHVNLSNLVDKYIGETEKNLERVFSFAEKTNVVLFFDEADSIFGRRGEVKDAQDKYSNNEVSYLLQRIEAYSGIVVMATNIKGNIDPAFMRRIRYVIHFDMPDDDVRRQIWESLITDKVPHEEIDVEYLTIQFKEFTGSIIKTVFLNACSKAAFQEEKLSMKHLIYAIWIELSKSSSVKFSLDTLGKYSYLL